MISRYLKPQIQKDIEKKMVLLAGPRQCGKTTLSKELPGAQEGYLNWDIEEDRERILSRKLPLSPLWIFDEIHKYRLWRNFLKGLYDKTRGSQKILVTGSAKLDLYRFGGDSLQGRYLFLRMHPLSVKELRLQSQGELEGFLALSGFPEPYFRGNREEADRWSALYRSRLVREEVPALENVKSIDQIDLLARSLPARVGAPLSINNLRENLGVSFRAVQNWLIIFEKLYLIFRLSPFGAPKLKAVKKEQKHYHFDWNLVLDEGSRFENFIACHLLKWVHFEEDTKGRGLELRYYRDELGREVDFVVTENLKPILFLEAKRSPQGIHPALRYLKSKFPKVRAIQVCLEDIRSFKNDEGIEVIGALEFLKELV
jgi:hypothetical protein